MLDALCGGKNIRKILLFLLVNGRCYGSQLQRLLDAPLTPIQKALQKLERGGLLKSSYEGKTRVYQFHPNNPLLPELEQLLKKSYSLLPAHEKKNYSYVPRETRSPVAEQRAEIQLLLTIWERLGRVTELTFEARSRTQEAGGWNGKGKGAVVVTKESDNLITFYERGMWKNDHGTDIDFSNSFRWTLDRSAKLLSLEHLRLGANNPISLCLLAPSTHNCLSSVNSHVCTADTYFAQIFLDEETIRLNWRIIGPKKNEEINCWYY